MKARVVLVLAMALVVVMASGVSAGPAARAAATRAAGGGVPFEAIFNVMCGQTGWDDITGVGTYWFKGDGLAVPLGWSHIEAATAFSYYEGPPHPYWGDFTITAANGDQLFGHMEGGFVYPFVKGTFVITGGAGSYQGVTGSGAFRGWTDGTGTNDWIHYKGTLTW